MYLSNSHFLHRKAKILPETIKDTADFWLKETGWSGLYLSGGIDEKGILRIFRFVMLSAEMVFRSPVEFCLTATLRGKIIKAVSSPSSSQSASSGARTLWNLRWRTIFPLFCWVRISWSSRCFTVLKRCNAGRGSANADSGWSAGYCAFPSSRLVDGHPRAGPNDGLALRHTTHHPCGRGS